MLGLGSDEISLGITSYMMSMDKSPLFQPLHDSFFSIIEGLFQLLKPSTLLASKTIVSHAICLGLPCQWSAPSMVMSVEVALLV